MKRFGQLLWLALLLAATFVSAADWRIGDRVYLDVTIKQVTPRAVIIQHRGGISQVLLADLPPEAQKQFGYDPATAQADAQRIQREHGAVMERLKVRRTTAAKNGQSNDSTGKIDALQKSFSQQPIIHEEVDLRPALRELGLFSKSQGRRPSCSVFAVVGALEYLAAQQGDPTQFSEEYAIWATRQYLAKSQNERLTDFSEGDAGFRLIDVIEAVNKYGLARHEEMPNTFGTGMDDIEPPSPKLLEQARKNLQIENTIQIGQTASAVDRITHALNAGQPVVIGVAWPHENTLRAAPMISGQTPVSMHAVTLVGYRADPDGGNQRFVFKNSWGPQWGSGGYGWITADYLRQHLSSAYLLAPTFLHGGEG
ncbi:C1 family peptidase [Cerasicoccus arenae]|uniref:Peptidase C1A papain C-terminal domain-containing protein n=1 Tax=Cerasicoccus arenae TaxID=424488 RepID=A0A8J3DIL4_9BACT|nr:C1 family peptidase [Cerasicoccus arenae]MBK1859517.1 C1 family peptidase [Cerasicoccus arenae]GHB97081.1 hypothetical protein GCM10007047_11340 [Cerasicoccus arenae]